MATVASLTSAMPVALDPHSHSIVGTPTSAGSYISSIATTIGAGGSYTTSAQQFGSFQLGANAPIQTQPTTVSMGKSGIRNLTIMLNGNPLPEGAKFAECRDLFLVDTKLDDDTNINRFHYEVWITNHGADLEDYGAILRSGEGCYIAFGSAATRDHYLQWTENYKNTFFDKYETLSEIAIPKITQGDITGIYVPDHPDFIENAFNLGTPIDIGTTKSWAWIVTNCHSPVMRIDGGWIFKDAKDAILFKMR